MSALQHKTTNAFSKRANRQCLPFLQLAIAAAGAHTLQHVVFASCEGFTRRGERGLMAGSLESLSPVRCFARVQPSPFVLILF